jgi:hypothetical protein
VHATPGKHRGLQPPTTAQLHEETRVRREAVMKGGGETYFSKLWPLELGSDQQCGAHGLLHRHDSQQAARAKRCWNFRVPQL